VAAKWYKLRKRPGITITHVKDDMS